MAVDARKGEISRLAALARDDKRGGFARGDKAGRGDEGCGFGRSDKGGGDGGHRHWVVPALVVVLRCMMVPQYGHKVAFSCIPSQTGATPTPTRARKRFPTHFCAYNPEQG
ncbi:hypothetical protein [Bifidobacterium aquikefiri]|uniref:hypothetical protein n=1 Tax=Bifidobacterium aquikefiri TaxID=1653207 RepID=UPI0039E91305